MFSKMKIMKSTEDCLTLSEKLKKQLRIADAVIVGAGAGLSTSAGFTYNGERFRKYFSDFAEKYGFEDMYSGGFIHFQLQKNTGHIGADISGLTVTRNCQNLFMGNC